MVVPAGGIGTAAGGVLPLELGGQAVARPAGVGVGLEEAEVADGGLAEVFERAEAVQRVDAPAGFVLAVALPVERSLPALARAWSSSPRRARARGGRSRSRR